MAIRNINYSVTADGITPATEQFAGTQEEHNATSLVFNLDSALRMSLANYITEHEIKYRFDIYDGEGNVLQGDDAALIENGQVKETVTLNLAEPAARYGGKVSVYLVITAFNGDETKLNLYSFPAKLRFNNLPDGGEGDNNTREAITTLAEAAKTAADSAEQSAFEAAESEETAEVAMQQTIDARFALENGAEFIFEGGDSESEMSIKIVVDSALSDVSENPVQNKVVKKALDEKQDSDDIADIISDALTDFLETENFINAAFLANHPINSLYPTIDDTNPGEIYGGEWQQVAQGRALVGVGTGTDENEVDKTFTVGDNDGEYEHTLTVDEMPSHTHNSPTSKDTNSGAHEIGKKPGENEYDYTPPTPTSSTGGDQAHNNTQPSYGVYIWKRTA